MARKTTKKQTSYIRDLAAQLGDERNITIIADELIRDQVDGRVDILRDGEHASLMIEALRDRLGKGTTSAPKRAPIQRQVAAERRRDPCEDEVIVHRTSDGHVWYEY